MISPSPSDRASSPLSQYSWNVVDEWSPAAYNREHSYERHQVRAPMSSIQPQVSPYHPPWEQTEVQLSPQAVYDSAHRPSQPILRSESLPTPLPYISTNQQSMRLASTVAAPVNSDPSAFRGDYSSFSTPTIEMALFCLTIQREMLRSH